MTLSQSALAQDITAPQLVSYSISPPVMDVTTGDGTLTATAHVTDDLSGFASAGVLYASPNLATLLLLTFDATNRVSGNALDGVYEASLVVPQYSDAGSWSIYSFSIQDASANSVLIDPTTLPASAVFDVVSIADAGPPTIASLTASPSAVDVTTGPAPVTVTLHVTDDVSGLNYSVVTFESPSATEHASVTLGSAQRISGDALDGVYQGPVLIPQVAENGTWTVSQIEAVDTFGYVASQPGSSLPPPGPPTIEVSSSSDSGVPVLVSLSVDPAPVDIGNGDQTVTLTVHITDDVTGVVSAGALLRSPVDAVTVSVSFDTANPISGDALDGVYQATATIAAGSPVGLWRIYILCADAVGNNFQLDGGALPGPPFLSVVDVAMSPVPLLGRLGTALLAACLLTFGAALSRARKGSFWIL